MCPLSRAVSTGIGSSGVDGRSSTEHWERPQPARQRDEIRGGPFARSRGRGGDACPELFTPAIRTLRGATRAAWASVRDRCRAATRLHGQARRIWWCSFIFTFIHYYFLIRKRGRWAHTQQVLSGYLCFESARLFRAVSYSLSFVTLVENCHAEEFSGVKVCPPFFPLEFHPSPDPAVFAVAFDVSSMFCLPKFYGPEPTTRAPRPLSPGGEGSSPRPRGASAVAACDDRTAPDLPGERSMVRPPSGSDTGVLPRMSDRAQPRNHLQPPIRIQNNPSRHNPSAQRKPCIIIWIFRISHWKLS